MVTLDDLIESTRHALSGFDSARETVTATAAPVSVSDLVVQVEDASPQTGIATGLIEVGLELMRVKSVDPVAGQLTLFPFGRGYRGTVKAAHPAGSEVRSNPQWARVTVAREINGVLTEIYPHVYGVRVHETTFPNDRGAIDLPDEAVSVLSVSVEDERRPGQWFPEDRWSHRPDSSDDGRVLRVGGFHRPGRGLRVVYEVRPNLFDLAGDPGQGFEETTGLQARHADLIRLGVAVRLAPFVDVAKLPFVAAAAREAGDAKAPGTAASATRLLHTLFQQRLEQEARVLAKEHPIRLHRAR